MTDKNLTNNEKIAKWQKEKLGENVYNELREKAITDNEIIKALECCGSNVMFEHCKDCHYDSLSRAICTIRLAKDALDLINRLQAELDELKNNHIPKVKNALRRANEIGRDIDLENERLRAENERLKKETEIMGAYIKGNRWGLISFVEFCKNLKAEAYKECIEKVISKSTYNALEMFYITPEEYLKELVGNNDETKAF